MREMTIAEIAIAIEDSRDADADTDTSLDAELAAKLNKTLAGFARSLTGAANVLKARLLNRQSVEFLSKSQPSSLILSIPHPFVALDVPAMGFAWIDPDAARARSAG